MIGDATAGEVCNNNMISSNKFIDFETITVTRNKIDEILEYVQPLERRPINARINSKTIDSVVTCHSPSYTVKPVRYLSSSELMVSVAQVCHILIDYYVSDDNFRYKTILTTEKIKELRLDHEIYFTDMDFSFKCKIPSTNYNINIELLKYKYFKSLFFAYFRFNVHENLFGNFKAFLSVV